MKKRLKTCHFTSGHTRNDIRVFIKECVSLAESGIGVSLVVADGLGDEVLEGVKIYDVGKSAGRFNRFFKTSKKVYKKAKSLNCQVYHFHDPELMWYGNKLTKHAKVIYDIHEDVTQQIKIRSWIPKIFKPIVSIAYKNFENYICIRMNALIVPQPYMVNKFSKLNKNTVLVENFVIFNNEFSLGEKNYNKNISFHPGALTEERGLINMISSYSILDNSNKLILAGGINDELLSKIKKLKGWEKTTYLGKIPYNEVKRYFDKASIGLILYNNVGQYHLSYAIKLFEYMSNGIPVIMPNFGEWVAFNEENNCGINVNPNNYKEVSNAIKYLNNNIEEKKRLGNNGYLAVKNKYNWKIAKNRLIQLYKNLLTNHY